jgi:hypothetical protein
VPCLAPPQCYPPEDGGCWSGLLAGACGADMTPGWFGVDRLRVFLIIPEALP